MRSGVEGPRRRHHDGQRAAEGAADYSVAVKLPAGLTQGNYYLSACTPKGDGDAGALGCATARRTS